MEVFFLTLTKQLDSVINVKARVVWSKPTTERFFAEKIVLITIPLVNIYGAVSYFQLRVTSYEWPVKEGI